METKHTAGPWTAVTDLAHGAFSKAWQIRDGDGNVICRLPTGLSAREAANADLIASAPDILVELNARCAEANLLRTQNAELLAALEACIADGFLAGEVLDQASAAISKATGAQS